MEWVNYSPTFDYEQDVSFIKGGPWEGHINFAYDLVRFLKPKQIVELGTYYGASFFSFCQAIKDEKCLTKCYAIDTWKGDEHSGYYGEDVFDTVKSLVQKYYNEFGIMIRSTFDEAADKFEDETIDLLHIDGFHTYEAVSHDYETWLPKLSSNSVVLFHDIAVYDRGFEVYKLWNELNRKHPSFDFKHSHGLGILFPKGHSDEMANLFTSLDMIKKIYDL